MGWAGVMSLYAGLYAVWALASLVTDPRRVVVGNLAGLWPGLLAAHAALTLARAPQLSLRLRQAWGLMGLAVGCWLLSDVIGAIYELILGVRLPAPSLADPLSLVGYCLAVAALLTYPTITRERFGRARLLLDMGLTSGAAIALGWLVLLRPILSTLTTISPADVFWAIVYPMADLALLLIWLNVWLVLGVGRWRSALSFVAAGFAAFAIAHLGYTYLAVRGQYETGHPVDLGLVIGTSLIGLGALYQRDHLNEKLYPAGDVQRPLLLQRAQALLPLATTIVLGWYVVVDWQLTGRLDPVGLWAVFLLGLTVVARQGVVAGEVELRQYAELVQNAADPAFICGPDGRLQLVNPALLSATQYRHASELVGQPLSQLLSLGGAMPRPDYLLKHGWSGEAALHRRDGAPLPVYLSLRPVHHDVTSRSALAGTAHDLTHIKEQEASLRAAYEQVAAARRELETLNAELEQKVAEKTRGLSEANLQLAQQNAALQTLDTLKSDFVSLVSHELRAPLTTVSGGIELLLTDPAELTPSARETLALVQTHIRRLTKFVETILDLSALESGRLPLYPVPLALDAALDVIRAQLSVGPTGARLLIALPADLPPVLADERALTSVISHLIDNALKYAPTGAVRVTADAGPGRVLVHVSDEGPGIPPEAREKIFEKFERLDPHDDRSVYGHGLGLYMSRRLLRALGGDIEAGAAPGGGARLTFWLPVMEDEHGP
jgi:PAS domain S-box-containing protein